MSFKGKIKKNKEDVALWHKCTISFTLIHLLQIIIDFSALLECNHVAHIV